jgi:hypothetical protein
MNFLALANYLGFLIVLIERLTKNLSPQSASANVVQTASTEIKVLMAAVQSPCDDTAIQNTEPAVQNRWSPVAELIRC